MQSKEVMKKLADNYETLVFVSKRYPSSMSRLKNLLMSEGVSETSARRKIADLETEAGCLVLERGGSLKLNQELISQMFLQIQTELNFPNRLAEEQEQQLAVWKRKLEVLERQKADEIKALKSEIESYKRMVERQKKDFKTEKESYELSHRIDRDFYLEASRKLEAAEEKIADMKKGVWSYLKVCRKDRREERLKEKRIKRERKERQKLYEEAERRQAKIITEMRKSGYGRGVRMSKYMYEHTKMPPYLPMPRFLLNCPISNTAKMLYIRLLGKAQLSQKNRWLDGQGRVYFIYPIHQMAADMNKSETTIKDAMKELVKVQLLEKIPEGRGRPNRLYILFPDEEQGQKFAVGNPTGVGQKTVGNYGRNQSPSKYISKKNSNPLRDYDYDEKESF